MSENRRSFLKKAGYSALGVGGLPLLGAGCNADRQDPAGGESTGKQYAMVVDVEKCLRDDVRQACSAACRRAHNIPEIPETPEINAQRQIEWIWTAEYQHAFPDQTHAHMSEASLEMPVLVLCNHCTNPPCTKVCPTKATWKRESDGIVMMDMHRCIGCRYCMAACPYGSRSFNWGDPRPYIEKNADGKFPADYPTRSKGVVEKCSFCSERLRVGKQPACVEAAEAIPGAEGALAFGDLSEPDSNVNQLLRQKRTICRRPSLGTGPNVFYIV